MKILIRYTEEQLRRVGFCRAWNIFVQLGLTDWIVTLLKGLRTQSYREFINLFLPYNPTDSVELKLRHALKIDQDDIVWEKLEALDLFGKSKLIGMQMLPLLRLFKVY